jgi:membrane protease subunit HflK
MYLEAMENVYSGSGVNKVIVPNKGVTPTIPFLPLNDSSSSMKESK